MAIYKVTDGAIEGITLLTVHGLAALGYLIHIIRAGAENPLRLALMCPPGRSSVNGLPIAVAAQRHWVVHY
jgi:hypothetical protein